MIHNVHAMFRACVFDYNIRPIWLMSKIGDFLLRYSVQVRKISDFADRVGNSKLPKPKSMEL